MANALLTVFIVTYNHQDSIAKAIESVLGQRVDFDIRILLLEDCSTDGTLEVCRRYAQANPDRIELRAQPQNTGARHWREALKTEVRTPYFHVIEGDDWLTDMNYLARAVTFLEEHKDRNLHCGNCIYKEEDRETDCLSIQGTSLQVIGHDVGFGNFIYLHTSTRVYRTMFDFASLDKHEFPFHWDIILYWLYMDTGPAYLEGDVPVSVYNIHRQGVWNRMSDPEKVREIRRSVLVASRHFNFRNASYFLSFYQPGPLITTVRRYLGDRLTLRLVSLLEPGTR